MTVQERGKEGAREKSRKYLFNIAAHRAHTHALHHSRGGTHLSGTHYHALWGRDSFMACTPKIKWGVGIVWDRGRMGGLCSRSGKRYEP